MTETSPLLAHASLLRVSLDDAGRRTQTDAVIADLDIDGLRTLSGDAQKAAVGAVAASSSSSVLLPAYLAENTALWTSVDAFATRLLQRQQRALDTLTSIQCVSSAAVAHQQRQTGKRSSQPVTPSQNMSFCSTRGGGGGGGPLTGSSVDDGEHNATSPDASRSTAHTVPSALRYAAVLSSTGEDGHINPMVLQPVAEEGCFLQVPSTGFAQHCALWMTSTPGQGAKTASSAVSTSTGAALPLPDVVSYRSAVAARCRKAQMAPKSSSAAALAEDEGMIYGYAFFLCGEAFCPRRTVPAGSASEMNDPDGDVFTGTTCSSVRRHRARGVLLLLASDAPVLCTLRTIALEVVVCLSRLATRSQRDGSQHTLANLDRFFAKEVAPLIALTQRRGVSTSSMPGRPMLLQLPSSDRPVNVRYPAHRLHPYIDLPLHVLLCSFSFDALRVLHTLMIQEKRIFVIGCTAQHASACVTSAIALLSPMIWCAPIVPFLPPPCTQSPPPPPLASVSPAGSGSGNGSGGLTQYDVEGTQAEWWMLDALLASPAPQPSDTPELRPSTGFLVGSTSDIVAPVLLRLSAIAATTARTPTGTYARVSSNANAREAAFLDNRVWIVDARSGSIGIAPLDPLTTVTPALPPSIPSPAADLLAPRTDGVSTTTVVGAASTALSQSQHQQLVSAANRALFAVNAVNRPFAPLELPPSSEKLKNAVKRSITAEKRQAFRVAANAQQERQIEWFGVCAQELARLGRLALRFRWHGLRERRRQSWPYSMLMENASAGKCGLHINSSSYSFGSPAALSIRNADSLEASLNSAPESDDEGEDGYRPTQARPTPSTAPDEDDANGSSSSESGGSAGSCTGSSSTSSDDESGDSSSSTHSGEWADNGDGLMSSLRISSPEGPDALRAGREHTGADRGPVDPRILAPFGDTSQKTRLDRHAHMSSATREGQSIVVEAKRRKKSHHRHRHAHGGSHVIDEQAGTSTQKEEKKRHRRIHRPHLHRHKTEDMSPPRSASGKSGRCQGRLRSDAWGEGVSTFVHHALPKYDGQNRLPSFPTISFEALVDVHAAFLEYNSHRLFGSYRKGLVPVHYRTMNNGTGAVQPTGVALANRVGGIDVSAFLPATLGDSLDLAERVRQTASFRQFLHTLLCVEKLGVPGVLRGAFLLSNPASPPSVSSASTAQCDCMNNAYVASPRLFCLLTLFFERVRRRFGDLFPDVPSQITPYGTPSVVCGDAVRTNLALVLQQAAGAGGGEATLSSRPLRNTFADTGSLGTGALTGAAGSRGADRTVAPALVCALGVLAGRSGEELDMTVGGHSAGYGAGGGAGGTAAGMMGGKTGSNNNSGGSGGGMRRFFSKASKAMKHGLGGGSNTTGHTQTLPLPVYAQCYASVSTGPVCAYVVDRRSDQGKDDLFLSAAQQRERARRVASQQQYAALHTDFSLPDSPGHHVAYDYLPTSNTNAGLPAAAYAGTTTPQAQSTPSALASTGVGGGGGMEAEFLRAVASRPATATATTKHFSARTDPIARMALLVRQLPVDVIHHFDAYHPLLAPTEGTASTSLQAIFFPETLPGPDAVVAAVRTRGGGRGDDGVRLVLPTTDESQYLVRLSTLVPSNTRLKSTAAALYETSLVCPLPPPARGLSSVFHANHNRTAPGHIDAAHANRTADRKTSLKTPNARTTSLSSSFVAAATPPARAVIAPAPDVFDDLFATTAPVVTTTVPSLPPPSSQAPQTTTTTVETAHADPWGAFYFTSGAPAGYVGPSQDPPLHVPMPLPAPPATTTGSDGARWDDWWAAGPTVHAGPTSAAPSQPVRRTVAAPAPGSALDALFSFSSGAPEPAMTREPHSGANNESSGSPWGHADPAPRQNSLEDFF